MRTNPPVTLAVRRARRRFALLVLVLLALLAWIAVNLW